MYQLGRMQEFEPETESISAYLERLQLLIFSTLTLSEKERTCASTTLTNRQERVRPVTELGGTKTSRSRS